VLFVTGTPFARCSVFPPEADLLRVRNSTEFSELRRDIRESVCAVTTRAGAIRQGSGWLRSAMTLRQDTRSTSQLAPRYLSRERFGYCNARPYAHEAQARRSGAEVRAATTCARRHDLLEQRLCRQAGPFSVAQGVATVRDIYRLVSRLERIDAVQRQPSTCAVTPNPTLNRTRNSVRRPGLISFWPGRRPLPHAG
jgi:hypothetical protein